MESRSRHGCKQLATQEELGAAMQTRVAKPRLKRSAARQCCFLLQHCSCACAARPSTSCVGGLPPQIGMMPVEAPAFGGCLMAPGPQRRTAEPRDAQRCSAKHGGREGKGVSETTQHEANTFEVPVRGRDVPRPRRGRSQSTAPQRASSSRSYCDAESYVTKKRTAKQLAEQLVTRSRLVVLVQRAA